MICDVQASGPLNEYFNGGRLHSPSDSLLLAITTTTTIGCTISAVRRHVQAAYDDGCLSLAIVNI